MSIASDADAVLAVAAANTLGAVTISGAGAVAVAAGVAQSLGEVSLVAGSGSESQASEAPAPAPRARGQIYTKRRLKKGFLGVPDAPQRVEPPKPLVAIKASVAVSLGPVSLQATASVTGLSRNARRRRAAAIALLLQ